MYDYCELDDWSEPDFDPITPADYGWVHENDIPNLDHVKKCLKGIVDSVYFTGDIDELENYLDEVCEEFDVKLPISEPVICQKTKGFSNDLFDVSIALGAVPSVQGRTLS